MSEIEVRIVHLEPMRVASAYDFGEQPETIAWEKVLDWAAGEGIEDLSQHRFFGFNNPNPSPGSPNYGYEIWMKVAGETTGSEEIEIKEVEGGLYAVTRLTDLNQIGRVWKDLVRWREESEFKPGRHQWLEHLRNIEETDLDKLVFDLYLPIVR